MWAGFVVASIATAFAVYRLYDTARRELEAQSLGAMTQELEKAARAVEARTDALRHTIIKTLAGFHVEGLAHALRKWDESMPLVTGTFQWDADAVPDEWRKFRAGEPRSPWIQMIKMSDNPAFPAAELGYQAENLEMLTYAGRPADPWASWNMGRGPEDSRWIFSYQAGPGAPVRGCVINLPDVVQQIRSEFSDQRLARIELMPFGRYAETKRTKLAATGMPGWVLVAEPGMLFTEKQNTARRWGLGILGLLGMFLLGAVFLARYSQREILDAERKTTFVTQVSHELRTPLTSIRMFADMLATPELPEPKRAKYAATISRESQRLGALIERLLTFHALEKGTQSPAVTPIDVGAVVRETLEEMEAPLRAAGMHTAAALPPAPVIAASDPATLKQALLNLLDNAVKYARDGKVIDVTLASSAELVRVRVADRGAGISRALGERVFEPFVQGGQTLTDKSPGVGLGLSIARGLLRKAGGDLVLLPSEVGAVFEIRLPVASTS